MENKEKKGTESNEVTKPKKQATSITYTLTALRGNIDKLWELKLIEKEDYEKLIEIRKKAIVKYTENL